MKPHHFAGLAAAALASLLVTLIVYSANAPWTPTQASGGKLAPSLAGQTGAITTIEISQGGDKLTLAKEGDDWNLKDYDAYPASNEKIRALLIALAEGELIEAKTRRPNRHNLLEVEDPSQKNANSRLIRILDADAKPITEVIAGKQTTNRLTGKQGTYVRKINDDQSWLLSTTLSGSTSLRDWTQPRVFESATEQISKAIIEVEGEEPYNVKRWEQQHVLETVPPGKKIKYVNIVDNIMEAASFLDIEDVRKPKSGTERAGKATLFIDPGLTVALNISRDDDGTWVVFDVSGEGDAKERANKLKAQVDGWEFKILPSKANTILKKPDELLEDAQS